jgi:hypothetical protein
MDGARMAHAVGLVTTAAVGILRGVPNFKRHAHWKDWAGSSVAVAALAELADDLIAELGDVI